MANDYLIGKWKLWFKFIDMKHRGAVSREDIKEEEEAFVKAAHLDEQHKAEFMTKVDSIVDDLIFHSKAGEITETDFIELTNNDFKADREKFSEKMRNGLETDFDLWDQNKTGSITEDQVLLAFKSIGMTDEAWSKRFFQAFKPVDGKMHKKDYIETMLPYLTSEDSSVEDPVLELFNSYPDM